MISEWLWTEVKSRQKKKYWSTDTWKIDYFVHCYSPNLSCTWAEFRQIPLMWNSQISHQTGVIEHNHLKTAARSSLWLAGCEILERRKYNIFNLPDAAFQKWASELRCACLARLDKLLFWPMCKNASLVKALCCGLMNGAQRGAMSLCGRINHQEYSTSH